MAVFLRWTMFDPTTSTTYTFERNPNEMSSPFPARNLQPLATTAVSGRPIVFEGSSQPYEWSFGGDAVTKAQYEALRTWSEKKGYVYVSDHYGRVIPVLMTKFDPTPKRAVGKYWRHTYRMTTLIVGPVGPSTVGEVPA